MVTPLRRARFRQVSSRCIRDETGTMARVAQRVLMREPALVSPVAPAPTSLPKQRAGVQARPRGMPLHTKAAGSCSELTVPRRSLGSVKPELVIPVDSARVAEATVAERRLLPAAAGGIATMALNGALDSFARPPPYLLGFLWRLPCFAGPPSLLECA